MAEIQPSFNFQPLGCINQFAFTLPTLVKLGCLSIIVVHDLEVQTTP